MMCYLLYSWLTNLKENTKKKRKNKRETSVCKCVFSGEKKKSINAVDRVMGRKTPILFAF